MTTPTLITVTGTTNPLLGATEVWFRVPSILRHSSTDSVYLPVTLKAAVALDGTFSIVVPATNDPAWSPSNWTYKVTIIGPNLVEQYDAQVPYNQTPLDFSDILPSLSPSLGTLYAAYSHGSHVLVLNSGDPVPPGTPSNTVIFRKA